MLHQAISIDDVRVVPFAAGPAESLVVAELDPSRLPAHLLAEWQGLSDDASEPNSFQEPWFSVPGLRHLSDDPHLRLVEIREAGPGGGLIGVVPLCVKRGYARLPFHYVENWRHHHDFLGAPFVRRGYEQEFWAALIDHLDAAGWAPGLLHINGLVEEGPIHAALRSAAAARGRGAPVVQRISRAALESRLPPGEYYRSTVRKKKRKELARLANRLAELGTVESRTLDPGEDPRDWCEEFLALERAGWKGDNGSALACHPATERFFREAVAGAAAAGRLQMRRIDVDGRPIAMLVNFLAPPGSFSFKIAYDERYARYSPGVLVQLDNLAVLSLPGIAWMDSCAAENHSMIDSLWGERRSIVRVSVRLSGPRRALVYAAGRAAEEGWALVKRVARSVR